MARDSNPVSTTTVSSFTHLTLFAALRRTREAAPFPARSDADRPAPAGWAALRLPAAVDIFVLAELLFADSGRRWSSGADADVGFAWSGGDDGAGAVERQRALGSSANNTKFCSTYVGCYSMCARVA